MRYYSDPLNHSVISKQRLCRQHLQIQQQQPPYWLQSMLQLWLQLGLMQPLLQRLGKIHFGRVHMKPGKPLTFATVEGAVNERPKLVFALPGNPVSALVCFYLVCLPAIRGMAGFANPRLPMLQAQISEALALDPERPEYHRCFLAWDPRKSCFIATSTGIQASCRLMSLHKANALVLVPTGTGFCPAGTVLDAILFGNL